MVVTVNGKTYYMDGYLKSNLDMAKKVIRKDWDMLFCVDGPEGSGKSVLGMQCAFYVDPSFVINRVCFTPKEFENCILHNAQPYEAVVYDEAFSGLDSGGAMSRINRALKKTMAEIRQKNLFIFIVMPTYFDLMKYVALWRSRALISVYVGSNFERGFFNFYGKEKKQKLYLLGKKMYDYHVVQPNFKGRFTNFYVVDEKDYRDKKAKALTNRAIVRADEEDKRKVEQLLFDRLVSIDAGLTHKQKYTILGMPESTYFVKLRNIEDKSGL